MSEQSESEVEHTLFIVERDDLDDAVPYQVMKAEHPPDSEQAKALEGVMCQLVEAAEDETGEPHRLVTEVDTPEVTQRHYEMHEERIEGETLVTDGGVDQSEAAVEHGSEGPNYDVEIDADELAKDVAELSARRARKVEEYNSYARDEPVPMDREPGQLTEYQQWAVKEEAAVMAFANVIAMLQPEDKYGANTRYRDGGRVKVRPLLRELSRRCDETNERRNGFDINSQQAGEEHSAYSKVISLIRNQYAVGWPRLDDIGGNPIPEDKP